MPDRAGLMAAAQRKQTQLSAANAFNKTRQKARRTAKIKKAGGFGGSNSLDPRETDGSLRGRPGKQTKKGFNNPGFTPSKGNKPGGGVSTTMPVPRPGSSIMPINNTGGSAKKPKPKGSFSMPPRMVKK